MSVIRKIHHRLGRPAKALGVAILAVCAVVLVTEPVLADPPSWAPAWGYKGKHKHGHKYKYKYKSFNLGKLGKLGSLGTGYSAPYGLGSGGCDRGLIDKELVGGLLGAAAGGFAGSKIGDGRGQLAATAGGALLGFLVGGNIGRTMDAVDQNCIGQTLEYVPDGQTIKWNNPDTGGQYQVTPSRTYQSSGQQCREYTTHAVIGGKREHTYGQACRQPDGSWRLLIPTCIDQNP